jgi:type II secretory ATPase GspE/PulE/Tfp pilus assembly ATPase PilB-like protein
MERSFVDEIVEALSLPCGLVLVCAPTGQGKTTAIYQALLAVRDRGDRVFLNTDELTESPRQLWSLEKAGVTFLMGAELRAVRARATIMMGDLRSTAAAAAAVELARGGHLVIAVLRISNATGAFPRLIDMGIPPATLASVVRVVFGTRIVRIHQTLRVSEAIRELVVSGAERDAIWHQAVAEGMRPLFQPSVDYDL